MASIIEVLTLNIERVFVGKRRVIDQLLVALLCEGHVLIEDIPGVGKTQLINTLALSVNGLFKRVQFTPDLIPSDIMGFSMFNPATREFEFRPGAAMCNFLLADEINRASPKAQSSLLEIMEEFQVSVDGQTHQLPRPFMVLATQNPIESHGTFPLPEAQLDRFFLKLSIGYPSKEEEKIILDRFSIKNALKDIKPVLELKHVAYVQESVKAVQVEDCIKTYILDIVDYTRNNSSIRLGVSPRGSLNLLKAAKAFAYIKGRNYVLPDDVQEIAPAVLAHRLIINYDARSKRISPKDIIQNAISSVTVPKF